ncbi:MAG: CRTAC1 family protein [Bacteriovorax sp.]|nr:CRTAC1 family protein [Bacteriovorax sp.]
MNQKIIFSFFLILSACSTKHDPLRKISSMGSRGTYFEDITESSGVPVISGGSIVIGDFNNDQFPDFIINDRLFQNVTNGPIQFVDVTTRVGLDKMAGDAIFVDINNDGETDIVTTKGQIFLQKNKMFTEVSKQFGFSLDDHAFSLSFADVNRDGYADIIVGSSEISDGTTFKFLPGKFFLNVNGTSFKEDPRFSLEKYPAYTRGIEWADFDNDSFPDAYFSNYRLRQNFLFKNNNGVFREVASEYNVQGEYNTTTYVDPVNKLSYGPQYGHTIGSVWADFNNDGNFDLWAAHLVHKFVGKNGNGAYDIRGYVCDDSKIYQNLGPPDYRFNDVRKLSEIPMMVRGDWSVYKGDELWSQVTAADFDNDGLIDTYVAQVYNLKYSHSFLFKNKGNFKFADVSANEPTRVFDSYGAAWADFNNDGKMDLIVSGREGVDQNPRLKIFKNIYKNPKNHFVKIKLIGTTSGMNPVGTQVRIVSDKGLTMRQYEGVTGTLSQENDPNLHFGLGEAKTIKSVEVRWSSGKRQTVTGVELDKSWIVTELK